MDDERGTVGRRTVLRFAGTAAATAVVGAASGSTNEGGGTADGGRDAVGRGRGTDLGTITVALEDRPDGVAPHDYRGDTTRTVVRNGYEGLLDRNRTGAMRAALATGYEWAAENALEFTVREGVTFHDGTPLTAADVAYSIERIVDESVDVDSPQAGLLSGVREANVVDERTVVVRTGGTAGLVPAELASYGNVVAESWAEGRSETEENRSMNGTGPYTLADIEPDGVELRRHDDYWGRTPSAERVRFRAIDDDAARSSAARAGEVDVAARLPLSETGAVRSEDGLRLEAVPTTRVMFAAMRYDVAPFASVAFRRALNYAIDQQAIVDDALQGMGDVTGQPTLPGFTGHAADVDPYPYDPARAERLVAESGHAGASVELHASDRYTGGLAMARQVVDFVDALPNVSASLRRREFGELVGELVTGDVEDKPPWYLVAWGNQLFDGAQSMRPLLATEGAITSFSDDEIDRRLAEAGRETGRSRAAALRAASRRAHEQAPWVFLPRQYARYAVSETVAWTPRIDGVVDVAGMRASGDAGPQTTTEPGTPTPTPTTTTDTPTTTAGGPTFRLRTLDLPTRVVRGESLTVTATLENTGADDGVATVTVRIDGDPVAGESAVVGAGERRAVEVRVRGSRTGSLPVGDHDLTVAVGDESTTRTLVVTAASDDGTTPTDEPTPGTATTRPPTTSEADEDDPLAGGSDGGGLPGFGLPAALAGLTGAAALRRWRRDDEA